MLAEPADNKFQQRVIAAAEAALAANGSVGPLELLQHMALLQPSHVNEWRRGRIETLESLIQGSPEKLAKAFRHFHAWAAARNLKTIQASYLRASVQGNEALHVSATGDPVREEFYRTHYAPADLLDSKSRRLQANLNKAPDLVVFQTVAESVVCSECGVEMSRGDFLFMEKGQPLCLTCADLDALEFLPSGDGTLSRRARKHSPLSAVVVRFIRSRNRYERQGLLVMLEAIARAEVECLEDAAQRAVQREQDSIRRSHEDAAFIQQLTEAIRQQYPGCPSAEAKDIARHTALRGSGRVGRSAAGRALDQRAIGLAVMAHIRHVHTAYDELLMSGVDRQDARNQVREAMERVAAEWAGSG